MANYVYNTFFIKGTKQLASKIKTASFKLIEHCGHVCTIEKATIFNKFALSYLSA
jgi:pimeloyl-ACP methyl ester carboxylesterase